MRVTILIPTYNEQKILPELLASLTRMSPEPDEILLVDGGSTDLTMALALAGGIKAVIAPRKGRGAQINYGVQLASGDVVCVLHADSILPVDAIKIIRKTMKNDAIALASFTPRIAGPQGTRWGFTIHNYIKTWYAPLLTRPHLFFKGVRLLFGDHAMFFRKAHFLAVDGCDERVLIMEEADLCIKLSRFGRTMMVRRWVWTSDRRIVVWGRWRANWIYFKVGMMWALGARERLGAHYPDIR